MVRDQRDPLFGRESLFRKKLNELRTTGHISQLPQAEGRARSREIERNVYLEQVANTLAQTDQKDMERLTLLDTVTQLYNHSTIVRMLSVEVKRAKRYRMPMSVLLMSVDSFREIHASHGPLTSDSILRGVANFLIGTIRDVDIPARYDAETFLVICPNTDAAGISVLSERIRHKISTERVSDIGQNWTITVSVGVGSYPIQGTKDEDLMRIVQNALAQAEGEGGNRCVIAYGHDELGQP
jgi:diguanylate cyclase (GGDEF)-like protein